MILGTIFNGHLVLILSELDLFSLQFVRLMIIKIQIQKQAVAWLMALWQSFTTYYQPSTSTGQIGKYVIPRDLS